VEIASLLVQNPVIWLLDEPVNQLDIHHQQTMMELLINRARAKSGAVMTVLHDPNLACRYCSHVLMLFGSGHYLAGTTSKLLNKENLGKLYGHAIYALNDQGKTAFIPA
jgi:iron complex transport system ATP-binding protein